MNYSSSCVSGNMSNENGDDTMMEDAQASQNEEQNVDELEVEGNKLFLV